MLRWRMLGIGSLACVLAGVVAAAIEVQTGMAPPPVTIAHDAVGDQAAYVVYERTGSRWKQADVLVFEVAGIEETPSPSGDRRPALKVAWADDVEQRLTGETGQAQEGDVWTFTDLATRETMLRRTLMRNDTALSTLTDDYGPFLSEDPFRLFWEQAPALRPEATWIGLAGAAIGPAEAVPSEFTERQLVGLGLRRPGVTLLEAGVEATGPGIIDGIPVQGVRLVARAEFRLPTSHFVDDLTPRLAAERPVGLLRGHVPANADVGLSRTMWFADGIPYPVQVHDVLEGPFADQEFRADLDRFVAGSDPVPWNPGATPIPSLERSGPDSTHPEGGRAARGFTLEAAIEKARTSPVHADFQAWSAAHPGATLVRLVRLSPTEWNLGFGHPSGQLYVLVVSAAAPEQAALTSTAATGGVYSVRPFDAKELPTGHITLDAAERLWAALGGQGSSVIVQWGVFVFLRKPLQPIDDGTELHLQRRIIVNGWSIEGAPAGDSARQDHSLYVDSITGRPLLFMRQISASDLVAGKLQGLVDAVREPAPEPRPVDAAGTPREIGTDRGVLVTMTLLGLLWTAYFAPALRFAGAALLWPLYARLRRTDVENNPIREALASTIQQEPGISPPELHRVVGGGWSTVVYHLRVLETNGVVRSVRDGRHRRFFPATLPSDQTAPRAALRNVRSRRAWDLLRRNPGLDRRELARGLGVSVPAAMWHVERLRAAGLVGEDRLGRRHVYYGLDEPVAAPEDPSVS